MTDSITYKLINDNKNHQIEVSKDKQPLGVIYKVDEKSVFYFQKNNTINALELEDNIAIAVKLVELENAMNNTFV